MSKPCEKLNKPANNAIQNESISIINRFEKPLPLQYYDQKLNQQHVLLPNSPNSSTISQFSMMEIGNLQIPPALPKSSSV